ncbi:ATP-binding cassette domain-containing protein [Conexibacter sp. CPCC 206217]|uniref:ATP-binding cassette domain-containing protein n=1 Tax=Conexibacter sp. CPCC 206217 TaxID=3064574 RepID=UPI00271E8DA9|nr:ATP-binding cassette domain-containing protein [Conexibacter sp. CPCC 206217]MDO8208839.1 ATP-binding cassette domain-containing protein [Conexibacter sp. CPCC 206217]
MSAVEHDGRVVDALRVEHIAKRYGPVRALGDVSLSVRRGEVVGLLGDNGAGKSTLVKIISGFLKPDAGRIVIDGEQVALQSVVHAQSLGINTVYQDLALIDSLPVYRNLFLNRELRRRPLPWLDDRRMAREAERRLDEIGVSIPSVHTPTGQLSGGQRQAIAVARAVGAESRILLLDEPLAAMGAKEGAMILDLIRRIRDRREVAIVMIAHNYAQVLEICDEVKLLQNGSITLDRRAHETSVAELNEVVVEEYRRAREAISRG